jgi:predicted  nucleic acid-binding Zn-ribbon protein
MTRSRDQVLSQKAELSQAILKANGTIEQKDKDITVLQLSLNSAQREIDNFEDKLAAALAKADERRIFEARIAFPWRCFTASLSPFYCLFAD